MAHVWRVMAALTIYIFFCAFPSAAAYAWFNDVTDSYPASQDVPVSGSALTGADVPEGVYSITATTSSSMCKLSNVTLTSAGGELWATFTMSGAYNALYLGTAEAAAASTNEDGTDVSAYYISDPLEGYVSRQFSIPIPALNEHITLATYSGGSSGNDVGKWYTRTVAFNSSSEVDDAISGGDGGQDEGGDDAPSDDSGDSGDDGYDPDDSDDGGSQGDEAYDGESADDGTSADDGSTGDSEEEGTDSKGKSSSSAASKTPSSDAESDSDGSDGDAATEDEGNTNEEESSDEAASSESSAAKNDETKGGVRMREIKFAGNQVVELGEGVDPELQQQDDGQDDSQNAGVVAASALGALNVALVGAYVVGLRRARPQLFDKAAKKISSFKRKD